MIAIKDDKNAGIFQRIRASLAEECAETQIVESLKTVYSSHSVHDGRATVRLEPHKLMSIRDLFTPRRWVEPSSPIDTRRKTNMFLNLESNATGERSVEEQIESLFAHERKCYDEIKSQWQGTECFDELSKRWVRVKRNVEFSDEMYLLFARCSNFDVEQSLDLMDKFNPRYLSLTCTSLEKQLCSKTLFVPPGLKTNAGLDVLYMRPSRHFPRRTPTSAIIDNLIYVMQTMQKRENSCTDGIAFLANMDGWRRDNFSVEYAHAFMKALQGHLYPVRMNLFLICDPPSWFGVIWDALSEQVLTTEFSKRVHIVYSCDLDRYLHPGYQQYLPDDMLGGNNQTSQIVEDFMAHRKALEGGKSSELERVGAEDDDTQSCIF